MNVNALFPGCTNDSYIWNNSNVKQVVRQLYENGHKGYFFLGRKFKLPINSVKS